jgi:hypothetical protein
MVLQAFLAGRARLAAGQHTFSHVIDFGAELVLLAEKALLGDFDIRTLRGSLADVEAKPLVGKSRFQLHKGFLKVQPCRPCFMGVVCR